VDIPHKSVWTVQLTIFAVALFGAAFTTTAALVRAGQQRASVEEPIRRRVRNALTG
jgi:hypothetical protein